MSKHTKMIQVTPAQRIEYLEAESKAECRKILMRSREKDAATLAARSNTFIEILRTLECQR